MTRLLLFALFAGLSKSIAASAADNPVPAQSITCTSRSTETTAPAEGTGNNTTPLPDASPVNTENSDRAPSALASPVIGNIQITMLPIFNENDPTEDYWIFHWVNRLHIDTHAYVLKNSLLFDTGDAYNPEQVAESERILRHRRFLREPHVTASQGCDNTMDVQVDAHEVWTLLPQVNYSHKGGTSSSSFGLKDSNFFGTGKELSVKHENGIDRSSNVIGYRDPNLGSLHSFLILEYADTSDGKYYKADIERPFFSLDTRWAASLLALQSTRTDSLFYRNEVFQSFQHQDGEFSIAYGRSTGLVNNETNRFSIGVTKKSDRFSKVADTIPGQVFPQDHLYVYPWIDWEYIADAYTTDMNINQMSITEDLNTAWSYHTRLGYSSSAFGAEDRAVAFQMGAERSFQLSENQILFNSSHIIGYFQDNELNDTRTSIYTRYHLRTSRFQQFFAGVQMDYGKNLHIDEPYYLGGQDGMRGYPLRYQIGDRNVLASIEERFYTTYELLKLFNVAGAVYFDHGRTWFGDRSNGENGGWLSDVGIGMRLAPTRSGLHRSGNGTIIHLDIAAPLDGGSDLKKWQWSAQVKDSF